MKHFYLLYVIFILRNQVKAPLVTGRNTRVCCVWYHVVLTALNVNSLELSIYAVNRFGATDGGPWKPHRIDPNINYRMWSLVDMPKVGLMVLNPSGSNFYSNGSFNGGENKFPFLNQFFPFYEATWK